MLCLIFGPWSYICGAVGEGSAGSSAAAMRVPKSFMAS